MPAADIKIVRHGDPVPYPEVDDPIHLTDAWQVVLLEGGMSSGKPSIGLRLDLPDGRTVIAETSLAVLVAITAAARGAFPGEFVGGPFEDRA